MKNTSACAFALRTTLHFALISVSALLLAGAAVAATPNVIQKGPVSTVNGNDAIDPQPGRQGGGGTFNSLFYVQPGEGEASISWIAVNAV